MTHPSEPTYIAMISGSNWFTNNDNPANRFDHTNLVHELDAHHISWAAYMEALPPSDPPTDFWPSSTDLLYASKHDPFALFTDIRSDPARVANIKPYTARPGDLNIPHVPRFVFITLDKCNDLHGRVNDATAGHPETPCPFSSANDDPNVVRFLQAVEVEKDYVLKESGQTMHFLPDPYLGELLLEWTELRLDPIENHPSRNGQEIQPGLARHHTSQPLCLGGAALFTLAGRRGRSSAAHWRYRR